MEMRRAFSDGDLNYLANLCHSCSACYYDCQFSPPHEFNVNVPAVLAKVRTESYEAYAWPAFLSGSFQRNGLVISIVTAICIFVFVVGFAAFHDSSTLFGVHTGPGAFYKLMPHNTMAALFGAAFLFAVTAIAMGVRNFWRSIGEPAGVLIQMTSVWRAIKDASTLRYLDGGGVGCMSDSDKPTDNRRMYHHFTFYGFMLCFSATSTATGYHYLLGMQAPYPWYDLPVVLGTLGGIGLIIGPIGLLRDKSKRDAAIQVKSNYGMDVAFLVMLLLTSITGLLLLILRSTPAMGVLLALHIGIVFSLFITMPYGKFVHGFYRFVALVRYAKERREHGLD
jgi:citrate/tricarballylate utilization protein